ncbi:hypothetical protein CEXT_217941 [Caerostris extrusa]|uniref:Uncharacterized protein n=1 Tax=Caerostris extrusa TaxID=172846 RepID=A0AAV4XTI8_CAEEX|nr:hypothetical protein CEXT_217941 [Caerostris extrusa]
MRSLLVSSQTTDGCFPPRCRFSRSKVIFALALVDRNDGYKSGNLKTNRSKIAQLISRNPMANTDKEKGELFLAHGLEF